jgi:hypothetical protein
MTDLAGTLLSIGLAPLLGFLTELRKTGSLVISDGPLKGSLFLEGGRVVGAVFGSERGLTAFEAIVLVLGGGRFEFDENVAEREFNFMVDPQVLSEHVRQLSDERARFVDVLPSLVVVPSVTAAGAEPDEANLNSGDLQLWSEVDGRRSVLELAHERGLVATARGLSRLVELGVVTLEPVQTVGAASPLPAKANA